MQGIQNAGVINSSYPYYITNQKNYNHKLMHNIITISKNITKFIV